MHRFFFILAVILLLPDRAAFAAGTADLVVKQPAGPLDPGSACAGPHPAVLVKVKNRGTAANVAVASPDGASIAGGPLVGYAALPAIAPGAEATLSFTVVSTRVSTSPPKRAERLITMSVQLDPKHRAGLPANSTDVPALLTSETCTGPEESPSPAPTPSPSPSPVPSASTFVIKPIVVPTATSSATSNGPPLSQGIMRGGFAPIRSFAAAPTPTPTPTPFLPPLAAHVAPPVIALANVPLGVPQHLREPSNMQDCTSHAGLAGGLVCAAVFGPNGSGLALVWDSYPSKVDGFRLYTVRGGRKAISPQINANGNGVTLGYVGGNSNSFNAQCFVVTAFVGARESEESAPFCVQGSVGASATTLTPDHIGTYEQSAGGNTGVLGSLIDGLLDPAGIFRGLLTPNSHGWVDGSALTGHEYRTNKSTFGDSFYNDAHPRGRLRVYGPGQRSPENAELVRRYRRARYAIVVGRNERTLQRRSRLCRDRGLGPDGHGRRDAQRAQLGERFRQRRLHLGRKR
jgi:hypothetical protein